MIKKKEKKLLIFGEFNHYFSEIIYNEIVLIIYFNKDK